MKKLVLMLLLLPIVASGYLLTEDIPNLLQNVLNYIKQGLQYASQLETQYATQGTYLKEVTQVEQQLLQLERLGDPKALVNLPGIQQIALLEQIYAQATVDVQHMASLANPANATIPYQTILSQYSQTAFMGSTSGFGVRITPATGLIQFEQSSFGVADAASQRIQQLTAQKQMLTTQRDQAIQSESSATDTETRTRYHNQVVSLSAAIADINASIQQTVQQQNLQQTQINAARSLYQTSNSLATAAAFQADAENGVTGMNGPTGTITTQATEFGYVDNPANGGGGDPGTSGNWYTGAGGQYIGGQNSTGVSLPAATEIAQYGSIAAAQNQPVTVTDLDTGQSVQTTIVDVGPGNSRASQGYGADLTFGTARALGMSVNGSANVQISFGNNSPN